MIKFYWNVITGLEFYIFEKPIVNKKSKKRKRKVDKKSNWQLFSLNAVATSVFDV